MKTQNFTVSVRLNAIVSFALNAESLEDALAVWMLIGISNEPGN